MKINTTLVGNKIHLKDLDRSNATETYLSWLSDRDINKYLEIRFNPPGSINELTDFICKTSESNVALMLGIFLNEGSRHIGNIKVGPIDWRHKTGDIGFLIGDSSEWGKGHAKDAIALFVEYLFSTVGLMKLTAGLYSDNEGSRRSLLKAGFSQEGRRISQCLVDGIRQDVILMGKVNPLLEAAIA